MWQIIYFLLCPNGLPDLANLLKISGGAGTWQSGFFNQNCRLSCWIVMTIQLSVKCFMLFLMKNSIKQTGFHFLARRMVKGYVNKFYAKTLVEA